MMPSYASCITGPCITNVFATRRKLLSHWLKFLRHVAITLVIQGPGPLGGKGIGHRWINLIKGQLCTPLVFLLSDWTQFWTKSQFAGRHFQMDFLEWNVWILIEILLKSVPMCPMNNIPPLVQIMAWRRPMMVSLLTPISVTRPQCVKCLYDIYFIQFGMGSPVRYIGLIIGACLLDGHYWYYYTDTLYSF